MAEPGSGAYGGMSEAQRNAIVEALLAQAYQQQSAPPSMYGDSVAVGDPYAWPADPSDPATELRHRRPMFRSLSWHLRATSADQLRASPPWPPTRSQRPQRGRAYGGNLASPSPASPPPWRRRAACGAARGVLCSGCTPAILGYRAQAAQPLRPPRPLRRQPALRHHGPLSRPALTHREATRTAPAFNAFDGARWPRPQH